MQILGVQALDAHSFPSTHIPPRAVWFGLITRDTGEDSESMQKLGCIGYLLRRPGSSTSGLPCVEFRFGFGFPGESLGSTSSEFAPSQPDSPKPNRIATHKIPKDISIRYPLVDKSRVYYEPELRNVLTPPGP